MVLDTVRVMYRERMEMAQALQDTGEIIMSLEVCLSVLMQIICVAFHLLVWQVDVMSGFGVSFWIQGWKGGAEGGWGRVPC
jgi:hypothetical protein